MAITQFEGPLVVGGRAPINAVSGTPYTASYNPDAGPSMFSVGVGVNDPRYNYQDAYGRLRMLGFYVPEFMLCLDTAPATASSTAIAAAQAPVAGTALTLTAGTGVTLLSTAVNPYPTQNTVAAGNLVIGASPSYITFGTNQAIGVYDPSTMLTRAVGVTSVGNDASATFTVRGYDVYGYPLTETITGASGTTAPGKKAWKFVTSVTPAGTLSGSNVSVGTLDIFGFPERLDSFPYVRATWNSAAVTSGGFTYAVTSTATATTGDVRGTYAPGTAADGVKTLSVWIALPPANALTAGNVGMFGVPQA